MTYNVECQYTCCSYLPTVPHSTGLSRKNHHRPEVPREGLIFPHFNVLAPGAQRIHTWPAPPLHGLYTCARLLVMQKWKEISSVFANEGLVSVQVIESAKTATSFITNFIIFSQCPPKMSQVSCIDFYSGWQVWLLLLYTAARVQSEFLLSFVDVFRPTVHCKVLLLSSPKAWLVSFNGLVRHCAYHTHVFC